MYGTSLIFGHTEHLFEVVCKTVCVGMCCGKTEDEGLLLPENVREMFGKVGGARLEKKDSRRRTACLAMMS